MGKPTIFLSHSSLNKAPLAALKSLLDTRAAGSLNFFLSSDGESIRFGSNWVVRISDALSEAKLMFLFLSPQSADSKWIHFEAGCAYAKDIQVVPVCLPGLDLNQIKAPLNLLQGFNLHSYEALGNLARICNETFDMKINESFTEEDFAKIVRDLSGQAIGFFGEQSLAINSIKMGIAGQLIEKDYNPILKLDEIYKVAGVRCFFTATGGDTEPMKVKFESPGCQIDFEHIEDPHARDSRHQRVRMQKAEGMPIEKANPTSFIIQATLSPGLFHLNAPLLDQWRKKTGLERVSVRIHFEKQIDHEKERHRLTTKLYQCGISMVGLDQVSGFEFDGFKFSLDTWNKVVYASCKVEGPLEDKRLSAIVERLFKADVLWIHEPDLSEMF